MNGSKDLSFGQDARSKMMNGVRQLAKAVKATLGPRGRFAVIQRDGQEPHITKDGVSTAKAIRLDDPLENLGAQVVQQAAQKVCDLVGDGTTSVSVLTEAILSEGLRLVAAGHDPMALRRGIDKATEILVAHIKAQAQEVNSQTQVNQVATISANGDEEVGRLISEAMEAVGKTGIITIDNSTKPTCSLRTTTGFEFDRGFASHFFVNDREKQRVVFEQSGNEPVRILLTNAKLESQKQLMDLFPIMEQCAKNGLSVLIIAESVEGFALTQFAYSANNGALKVAAVKAPGFGDQKRDLMNDLAVLTGAYLRNREAGEDLTANFQLEELGVARSVIITKDSTIIVGVDGREHQVNARVLELNHIIENAESALDRERAQERLAKLTGGVAVIEVGAPTEAAQRELRDRFDDAIGATKAAVAEGIVAGGGAALAHAAAKNTAFSTGNDDEDAGVKLLLRAAQEPLRQIVKNAGQSDDVVWHEVWNQENVNVGFDARSLEVKDLLKAGIVDPAKVVRTVLQTAASISGTFLCTETAITNKQTPTHKETSENYG